MSRKHCGKRRNFVQAISPLPTMFSEGFFPRPVKRCHCVGMGCTPTEGVFSGGVGYAGISLAVCLQKTSFIVLRTYLLLLYGIFIETVIV